jgi:hypothetical protein
MKLTPFLFLLTLSTPAVGQDTPVQVAPELTPIQDPGAIEPEAGGLPLPEVPTAEVMMLRLRDGAIVWGAIREHDPDGLRFARIEHGGVANVPWSLLDETQERELRQLYGYVDESGEELLIEADRLLLTDGREVIGKILSRDGDALLVKTAGATIRVPKNRIGAAATTVRVPAFEIYTREELYSQSVAGLLADDAGAQFELAQYCERILDFGHAVEHYLAAQELDPTFREDDVRWALERSRVKSERQEQIDYLSEVDLLSARKKFDEALLRAEAFFEIFPESPLFPDAQRRVERVEKARERSLRDLIAKTWHRAAANRARRAVGKSYQEVLVYLDGLMAEEVFNDVFEAAQRVQSDVEQDMVRQLWIEREGGRWRRASYGYGTWLLGEGPALEGMEPDEEEALPTTTSKDKERAELEQRIKRFLQNQQLQRQARSSEAQAEEQELSWKLLSSGARASWILAYYAEQSGDMELRQPRFRHCRECGGKGVREVISTGNARTQRNPGQGGGGGMNKIQCPTCRGIGIVRRIDYR